MATPIAHGLLGEVWFLLYMGHGGLHDHAAC
jgi:hypothetical protein